MDTLLGSAREKETESETIYFLRKERGNYSFHHFFRTFKDIFQAFCQTWIRSCTDKRGMCSSEDQLSTGLLFKLTDSGALLHIDSSNCFIFVKASVQEQLCDPGTEKYTFLPDISRSNQTAQSHFMS